MIEAADLRKTFTVYRRAGRLRRERRQVTAVDGVSFSVQPGEMVGYIGPNGAGKSTTIKMLTGILVPTSGRVIVAGLAPARKRTELARRIGVVFGNRSLLWWDLPLRDSFELLRHIYRVPAADHHRRLAELRELLDLGPFLDTPVRQLSLGQRMRGELTAALLHAPKVLFLDEPTVGLDIVSKARVRGFLAELNRQRGVTVLLTTHDLSDIERLCPRMLIIDHGQVLYDGGTLEIASRFGAERTLVVDLAETRPPLRLARASVVRTDGPRQWIKFRSDETTAATLISAVSDQAQLVDLSIEEPSIEEVVRRVYTGELVPA
ncbi:MAG TPA: ATP-binding cassette domain-containing protein [Candidatus Dormibacteraeota bacterium]|nr:ATP-binding cassette domain-containing protein [Candidatus Dormibacteraeota bacterium]